MRLRHAAFTMVAATVVQLAAFPAQAGFGVAMSQLADFRMTVVDLRPTDGIDPSVLEGDGEGEVSNANVRINHQSASDISGDWHDWIEAALDDGNGQVMAKATPGALNVNAVNEGTQHVWGSAGWQQKIVVGAYTSVTFTAMLSVIFDQTWIAPYSTAGGLLSLQGRLLPADRDDFWFETAYAPGFFDGDRLLTVTFANNTGSSIDAWLSARAVVELASPVPEPASAVLLLAGLGALGLRRR